MIQDKVISFLDLETTGSNFKHDRIIEVGVVQVMNGQIINEYQTLLSPGRSLPRMITNITGITDYDLIDAPEFAIVKDELLELLNGTILIAHNVNFDYGFLKAEFSRHGVDFSLKNACSVRISRMLYPEHRKHSLDAIIDRFGLQCDRRHRALDDAKIIWQFLEKAKSELGHEIVAEAFKKQTNLVNLPPGLYEKDLAAIPDTPGVYLFYGDSDYPLYIGKSKHIRTRVTSHFMSSKQETKEYKLFVGTKRIEYIETYGELGALILESRLIKELKPLHNKMLRRSKVLAQLYKWQNVHGYNTVKFEYADKVQLNMLDSIIGLFNNKKAAETFLDKIAIDYNLCPDLLSEKPTSNSECFNFQLGFCTGACIQAVSVEEYNKNFDAAFEGVKLKKWPFRDYVFVTEQSDDLKKGFLYVFKDWALVASGRFGDEAFELAKVDQINFDKDLYKILVSYFASNHDYQVISETELETYLNLSF